MQITTVVVLALSIAAHPVVVNAQTKSSPRKSTFPTLVQILMAEGNDDKIDNNLAPVIGLPHAMSIKVQDIIIAQNKNSREVRSSFVVYTEDERTKDKSPVCVYITKSKKSGRDRRTQYFRITLDGNLEKAIQSQGKHDDTGKPIRGSGVKFDQDINSPDVKKAFNSEMSYWLKDWLTKTRKTAGQSSP